MMTTLLPQDAVIAYDAAWLASVCRDTYTLRPTWRRNDLAALVAKKGSDLVIAFRGTEVDKVSNWEDDFSIWPTWRPKLGFVHRGFMQAVDDLYIPIATFLLDQAAQSTKPYYVVLSGHSLGGAMALLMAAKLRANGITVHSAVTFAAPKVGFGKLSRFLLTLPPMSIAQFVAEHDAVPFVPWPYQHVTEPHVLTGGEVMPLEAHGIANYCTLAAKAANYVD